MKKMFLALLILFISAHIFAQSQSNTLFTNGDEIHISLSDATDCYYIHEIKKGHSLYALSKTFGIAVNQLYKINGIAEGATLSIDQKIKVPIRDEHLFKGINLSGLKHGHYIPVFYTIKAKDNLFRISRIYFNQPTEDLVKRNGLKNNNLSLGQNILVGWLPIDNSTPRIEIEADEFEEDLDMTEDYPARYSDESSDLNDSNEEFIGPIQEGLPDSSSLIDVHPEGFNLSLLGELQYSKSMTQVEQSEVAHWDKAMPDNGMVYVLHQEAIIDSYIEMYNPILKRSVRAKVIGRIPYGAYTKDVRLVLSPRTAKQLGALDKRFKVEVKALFFQKK